MSNNPLSATRTTVAATRLAWLLLTPLPIQAAAPANYEPEREAFIHEMVARHGFERAELMTLMEDARYQQAIVDAMDRPYEGKSWGAYRALFVTPERIAGGRRFLAEHAPLLSQAERTYGVPAAVIVAIIGIETNYGATLGQHRVLDALSTLGFAYPRRAAFFRKELEEFLLLSREEAVDPSAVHGSYAGALGKPQFIPSSYRAYAVDFDGDGRRDLWDSDADVIGSVGAYLSEHGWVPGEPVASPATLRGPLDDKIEVGGKRPVVPSLSVAEIQAAGVEPAAALDPSAQAALIELDREGAEYWVVLDNFYAITRYNHSNLYALAAYELSRAIAGLDQ
ncbi:lytic murein transglycosylase B [Halochromatium salexigens]|uniref:Lytic murein transglycosylase B n=1 Tax=Halochromatium salexigens TaxID=49447 RepID=A0AAJ0UJX7_HALSE|nr:lytic murein transglycosylase B [Halochromatium salexigens]MBK5931940.1 lytic murein transglycosylase B [Halochromatium salexigens]